MVIMLGLGLAWLSTVSDYLLLRVFVLYYVPGSLWLRSLFSFGFWFIFALRNFHYEFHFTLFNHYAHLPT